MISGKTFCFIFFPLPSSKVSYFLSRCSFPFSVGELFFPNQCCYQCFPHQISLAEQYLSTLPASTVVAAVVIVSGWRLASAESMEHYFNGTIMLAYFYGLRCVGCEHHLISKSFARQCLTNDPNEKRHWISQRCRRIEVIIHSPQGSPGFPNVQYAVFEETYRCTVPRTLGNRSSCLLPLQH